MPRKLSNMWSPRRLLEDQYKGSMRKLLRCVSNLVDGINPQTPEEFLSTIDRLVTMDFFQEMAQIAARRMVTGVANENALSWREAAQKSHRGHEIYQMLLAEKRGALGSRIAQIVDENAKLISTFPQAISNNVAHWIEGEWTRGRRAQDLMEEMKTKYFGYSDARLMLIARTESSKASEALTAARCEVMGIPWYIWRATHDARVRLAHHKMDGVLCSFREPPNPERLAGEKRDYGAYQAGCLWNCRCASEPLLQLDYVQWPAKVHYQARIQRMTLHQFRMISGMQERRAA